MSERRELFRRAALKRLASPERYDKLVTLARPATWAALVGAGLIVALGALWAARDLLLP